MQRKLLNETNGQRTFALVLESGDEVMSCVRAVAEAEQLSAAQLTAIGAFSDAELAYFDWDRKQYLSTPVNEQVEVASLIGDVALRDDGRRDLHVHAVLGKRDGSALAGHLKQAHVRPTLEVILTESPSYLRKRIDQESGLALIRLQN
jgi:uncharacterized protein